MPTYVYHCQECGTTLERRQSFHDAPLTTHDDCGGPLRKLLHAAPVIFKGSGFYTTDHRSGSSTNGKSGTNGSKASDSSSDAAKGDTAKSESAKGESAKGESARNGSSGEKATSSSAAD